MRNPDLSREKSLYHLLLTVVRRMNAPISPHKKEISEALKLLEVTKSNGEYFITIDDPKKQRRTSIPVSELKFYDTKNDPTIASKNLQSANRIALELFPELASRGALQKNSKRFNYFDFLFIFYSLSMLLFYLFDSQVYLGVPAALAFGFIPFWNLSSNLNPRVRWLGSLVFSLVCFILFYSPSSRSWVELHLAIMLSLFLLAYSKKEALRIFSLSILGALLALMVSFDDYQIAAFAIVFVVAEKFIEFMFRINKKTGLVIFGIIFTSTMALMFLELSTLNNPLVTVLLGAILFGYLLFIFGVGSSWGGFLRTLLPSIGVLSLEGANAVMYLSITLVLFQCAKLASKVVDKNLDQS